VAVKSIIDIEINDAAFKAFKNLFDKHKKDLDKLPEVWQLTTDSIVETTDKADSLLHAIEAQTNILNKQLITQIKISEEMKKTDRNMVSIGSNSGKALKNIQGITFSMLKWGAITGALTTTFGLLSGATGFFGLDAMARGASQTRQQAGALGLNPNELQAVQTVYRRFSGSSALLGNISQAQVDYGKQWRLRNLGISQEDIEGKTSAQLMPQVIEALHARSQQALKQGTGAFTAQAEGYGWAELVGGIPNLRELAGHSSAEIETANRALPGTLEKLALGKDTISKWEDFIQSLETATGEITNKFVVALQGLAKPLGHITTAFADLLVKVFESKGFRDGLETFAAWLENLARNMEKPEFKESVDKFINTVTTLTSKFVSLLDWLAGGGKKGEETLTPQNPYGKAPIYWQGTQEQWNDLKRRQQAVKAEQDKAAEQTQNAIGTAYKYGTIPGLLYSIWNADSFWEKFKTGINKGLAGSAGGPAGANYASPNGYVPPPMQGAANNNSSTGKHFAYGEQYLEAKRPGAFSALEKQYDLPAGLLAQIHKQEWDPRHPVSSAGAMGPFQFMPGTAKDYGLDEKSVWDLAKSSEAAARYFQDLLVMFKGDVNKAAAGYNWGQGNVQKAINQYGDNWREHLPPETEKYLNNLNRSGLGVNSFTAQPGQGVKISLYNATGGQVNAVISSLAA